MFTSLAGRSVLVTGGSKGIGKGIARVFAQAGTNVTIAARDETALAAAAEGLAKEDGQIAWVAGDVAEPADCRRMAAAAQDRFGGIDVLCANAGVFPEARLADLPDADIDEVLGCNVNATMLSVQQYGASKAAADGGVHPAGAARRRRGHRQHLPVPCHGRGGLHHRTDPRC
jgi:3-oxoacyl-[acyl-carrier protein] reductase